MVPHAGLGRTLTHVSEDPADPELKRAFLTVSVCGLIMIALTTRDIFAASFGSLKWFLAACMLGLGCWITVLGMRWLLHFKANDER